MPLELAHLLERAAGLRGVLQKQRTFDLVFPPPEAAAGGAGGDAATTVAVTAVTATAFLADPWPQLRCPSPLPTVISCDETEEGQSIHSSQQSQESNSI